LTLPKNTYLILKLCNLQIPRINSGTAGTGGGVKSVEPCSLTVLSCWRYIPIKT